MLKANEFDQRKAPLTGSRRLWSVHKRTAEFLAHFGGENRHFETFGAREAFQDLIHPILDSWRNFD